MALLVHLYTDTLPTDMSVGDFRELLVLADRFCLSQLISVCENFTVFDLCSESVELNTLRQVDFSKKRPNYFK